MSETNRRHHVRLTRVVRSETAAAVLTSLLTLPVCPAGLKQLKWEAQRDDWIQGRDVKTLRRKKTMFNKKKMFGQKRAGGFRNTRKKK